MSPKPRRVVVLGQGAPEGLRIWSAANGRTMGRAEVWIDQQGRAARVGPISRVDPGPVEVRRFEAGRWRPIPPGQHRANRLPSALPGTAH